MTSNDFISRVILILWNPFTPIMAGRQRRMFVQSGIHYVIQPLILENLYLQSLLLRLEIRLEIRRKVFSTSGRGNIEAIKAVAN
jgi:hypothetical protein